MARNQSHFCTHCRTENEGKAVLQNESTVTKDWRWTCSNCNHVSEITEVVPEHVPKPLKRYTHERRFLIDDEMQESPSKN